MELGRASLRGNGVNVLQHGIHPRHGLVWTDGKAIYLAPVRLYGNDIENAKSLKLGEFDNVQSLHWSIDIDGATCFLCAIHQSNVTVWKVTGSAPKLGFKQVRKINVQPIPSGCLWHPGSQLLGLLGRHQCSFYSNHTASKTSFAFPQLESGKMTCGAWSADGCQLVLCVGAIMLIYTWPDIESSLSNYTPAAWKVPGLDGNITSILSLSHNSLLCAAELPLESLCKQQDMFVVPDVVKSSKDQIVNGQSSDVLTPRGGGETGVKERLLNLERNPQSLVADTSQLMVVELRDKLQDPALQTRVNIQGIVTPDVLAHEAGTNSIVVGSNSQSLLQVFTFLDADLVKVTDIQLDKNQRPKGSCRVPAIFAETSHGVLVVVGERDAADLAFPSASNLLQYRLKLKYFPIKLDKSCLRSSYSSMPKRTASDSVKQDHKVKSLSGSNLPSRTQSMTKDAVVTRSVHKTPVDIRISAPPPSQNAAGPTAPPRKMVVEMGAGDKPADLETETVQFSSQTPRFQNSHVDKFFNDGVDSKVGSRYENGVSNFTRMSTHISESRNVSSVTRDDGCVLEDSLSDPGNCSSITSGDSITSCEILEQQVRSQKEQISVLQKKIDELSQAVEDSSCVFPVKYQSPDRPEKVKIVYEADDGGRTSRTFLLDAGRLQLDPIKQAFGLATVELIMDGEPCVLGANIDGYVPMRFSPNSTLSITGVPACNSPPTPLTDRTNREGETSRC